jgi:CRP-like cAMP-binding protein
MLSRALQRSLQRLPVKAQLCGILKRPAQSARLSQQGPLTKLKTYIQREAGILKETMTSQSTVSASLPILSWKASKTLSLSDLAGHGSFVLLMCSYLVTDFFELRMFAASGVTLSILFQYYREKPLWIPIRWNSLFLAINLVMIALLMKEENDASNIPAEKKALYDSFARKGMNPVDFMLLINAAKRLDVKKGDVVVAEHLKNTRVYFVKSGTLSVMKNGSRIRAIHPMQFTGEMSFLRWEDRMDSGVYEKKHAKKATVKKWRSKDHEMELFLPLLIICEELFKQWGLSDWKSSLTFRSAAPVAETTTAQMLLTAASRSTTALPATQSMVQPQPMVSDDVRTEEAAYGVSVDASGHVITEEESFIPDPNIEQASPELTAFGRCLNASYGYIGGLFGVAREEHSTAEEAVPKPGSASEGEQAAATVIAEVDCVLYFWSFRRLRVLLDQHPSLGRAFERVLSDELNRKMVNTMQAEPLQRYQVLLANAIMDGEVSFHLFSQLFETLFCNKSPQYIVRSRVK